VGQRRQSRNLRKRAGPHDVTVITNVFQDKKRPAQLPAFVIVRP
jgi:hypothetical protein